MIASVDWLLDDWTLEDLRGINTFYWGVGLSAQILSVHHSSNMASQAPQIGLRLLALAAIVAGVALLLPPLLDMRWDVHYEGKWVPTESGWTQPEQGEPFTRANFNQALQYADADQDGYLDLTEVSDFGWLVCDRRVRASGALDPAFVQGKSSKFRMNMLARHFPTSAVKIDVEAVRWPPQEAQDKLTQALTVGQHEGGLMCWYEVAGFIQHASQPRGWFASHSYWLVDLVYRSLRRELDKVYLDLLGL